MWYRFIVLSGYEDVVELDARVEPKNNLYGVLGCSSAFPALLGVIVLCRREVVGGTGVIFGSASYDMKWNPIEIN